MRTIALYNIKGGVGKTTTTVNLAWFSAQGGQRTLVWDLDPQAASSFFFRIKPKVRKGSKGLLSGRVELEEAIKETDYPNLDLVPADFSFRHLDHHLAQSDHPKKALRRLLAPLAGEYDNIFLDCPPSISLLSEGVLYASDRVLVPTIPTTLSLRTLKQLQEFCEGQEIDTGKLVPFFSMVDRRKSLHRLILEHPPQGLPRFLHSAIPYASEIELMGQHQSPIGAYAPRSAVNRAYAQLWKEVMTRL